MTTEPFDPSRIIPNVCSSPNRKLAANRSNATKKINS
jgi:hypothetical protein